MIELKIEKGVPLTEKYPRQRKYAPIDKLEIGESFLVPTVSAANSVSRQLNKRGMKTASRKQADGQYRVWRTK